MNATNDYRWRVLYYHRRHFRIISTMIPKGKRVMVIGRKAGALLEFLNPSHGVGLGETNEDLIYFRSNFPQFSFHLDRLEDLKLNEKLDYIILYDRIGTLGDIQSYLQDLRRFLAAEGRLIIKYFSHLWWPILQLGRPFYPGRFGRNYNWVSLSDTLNFLEISGFQTISFRCETLMPLPIPLLSTWLNRYLARLPLISSLCLDVFYFARPKPEMAQAQPRISVILPVRNERDNIENAVKRLPPMGSHTEIIFVEGNSQDGTLEEIHRVMEAYGQDRDIKLIQQGEGKGKANAVWKGFEKATGDILIILDGDLTTPPEDMPKFVKAIEEGRGEFINGSRLIYPMEKQAMRFLNMVANRFFSYLFTWLTGQRFTDTLCGTKALLKSDYQEITANWDYFNKVDPFGDFDLIFGACHLQRKVIEIPVRYRAREYGETQILRFSHGLLLFRLALQAILKIKFIKDV